jgi:hypothetical protein
MRTFFSAIIIALCWFLVLPANTIHVPQDTSGIQAGINVAVNGDTVLVADSTYYENINFKGKAITVASLFIVDGDTNHINNTVINGSQPVNPDSGSVVSLVSGEDTTSILCGFTITGGTGSKATVPGLGILLGGGGIDCYYSGARICHNKIENNLLSNCDGAMGAGIRTGGPVLPDFSLVIIENNVIGYNTAQGTTFAQGAGIMLFCNGRITNNRIIHNEGHAQQQTAPGGGIFCSTVDAYYGNSVIISGNFVSHNKAISTANYFQNAWGGGLGVKYYNAHIFNNTITDNEVGGVNLTWGAGAILEYLGENSVFERNTVKDNFFSGSGICRGGGVCVWYCNQPIYLVNNIISGNLGSRGGGIYVGDQFEPSYPLIINNTISGNNASYGGGIYTTDSYSYIMNTILWGNSALAGKEIYTSGGILGVAYSDVEDSWPGTGNINLNPELVADSLSNTSSCTGAGIDVYDFGGGMVLYCPPQDINGRARPFPAGSNPDMGAWESKEGVVGIEPQPIAGIPESYALFQNYPNPFNPSTIISWQLAVGNPVKLTMYNLIGQKVTTLVDEWQPAGNHSIEFDASQLASGVYLYRLQAGSFSSIRKMIIMK